MPNLPSEKDRNQAFKGSRFWRLNIWGVALAVAVGAPLMLAIDTLQLWPGDSSSGRLLLAIVDSFVILALLYYFPGNMILRFPHEIQIEDGKGLWLHAGFRRLYIPIEDLRDAEYSRYGQGFVVRLKRRRHLLGQFVVR